LDPGRDVRHLLSQRHASRPHTHDPPIKRFHAPRANRADVRAWPPRRPQPTEHSARVTSSPASGGSGRRTRSADLAVDLTAETFVAALHAARRFKRGDTPAVGWLLGIARHKLLRSIERGRVEDRARKKLGTQRLEFDDEELERVDRLATRPAEELLGRLPPDQAEAIRARILEEQSYDVVAARLRCSPLVARKRVSRGLATLRDVLEER
jgi:RNA polymerase sigma factor (sigma-70 family)